MAARAAGPKLAVVKGGGAQVAGETTTESPYHTGDLIADKYELSQIIGEGGMGSVWRARNRVLDIDVAIKLINRQVASKEAAERLLLEARSAAQLGHSSIVRVHDFGETARGDAFIAMELLAGRSLAQILDREGALEPASAVQLLLPIIGALGAAHAKGVVHRDIKPDNIILVRDEQNSVTPKLVDFGIAKVEHHPLPDVSVDDSAEQQQQLGVRLARRLTMSGRLMGSPEYMSPEQARGDEVDGRTDLWAVAVVLYETITGTMPFSGDRVDKLLISVLTDRPPPTTEFEVGDESLWRIIERGLQKKKLQRWNSARELGEALAAWLLTQGMDTDVTGASVRQHWLGVRGADPLGAAAVGDDEDDTSDPQGIKATPPSTPELARPERAEEPQVGPAIPLDVRTRTDPPPKADKQRKLAMTVLFGAIVLLPTLGVVAAVVLLRQSETAAAAYPASVVTASVSRRTTTDHPPLLPSGSVATAEPPRAAATADAGPGSVTTRGKPDRPAYRPPPARPKPTPKPTAGKGAMPIPDVPNF